MEQKKALRAQMRETLKGLSEESRREQSAAACKSLLALPSFQNANTVLLYRALPSECDPAEFGELARALGKRVAYPVCGENYDLLLFVPRGENAFTQNNYGIFEPDRALSDEVHASELDFIVVPGLAFDKTGGRLGRGAGYYDRLLRQTSAFKAGFAFSEQLVEAVPMEAFDVKMDCVAAGRWIYCE